jgi:hypothetical protein
LVRFDFAQVIVWVWAVMGSDSSVPNRSNP